MRESGGVQAWSRLEMICVVRRVYEGDLAAGRLR